MCIWLLTIDLVKRMVSDRDIRMMDSTANILVSNRNTFCNLIGISRITVGDNMSLKQTSGKEIQWKQTHLNCSFFYWPIRIHCWAKVSPLLFHKLPQIVKIVQVNYNFKYPILHCSLTGYQDVTKNYYSSETTESI